MGGAATKSRRPGARSCSVLPTATCWRCRRATRCTNTGLTVLGSGGFGITYLAHDTHLDCPVAIKEYLPRDTAGRGPDLVRAAALDWRAPSPSPGGSIASCRNAAHSPAFTIRASSACCAILPPTTRPTWSWNTKAANPSTGGWPVASQSTPACCNASCGRLLDGLETIHNAGFLHRDIKPRNIYMRADGSPVLLDFGSARRRRWAGAGAAC
jgi:hypothetical protein